MSEEHPQTSEPLEGAAGVAEGPLDGAPGDPEPGDVVPEGEEPGGPPSRAPSGPSTARVAAVLVALGLVSVGLVVASRSKGAPASAPLALTSAAVEAPLSISVPAALTTASAAPPAPAPPPVWRLASLSGDAGTILSDTKVGRHKSFIAAAIAAGVSRTEARRVAAAFEGVHPLGRVRSTDALAFAREKASGRVVAFELTTSPTDVYQARDEGDGRLVAKKLALHVEERDLRVALALTKDLDAAAAASGHDTHLAHAIDDALHGHVSPSELRAGARLRVVGKEVRVEGELARVSVEAVELSTAEDAEGKGRRVYFYSRAQEGSRRGPSGFYNASGQQPYQGAFRSPVPLARVTSRFNPKRMHPVLHVVMPHNGVDFGASTGTPVYASAEGSVVSAGGAGPCGNMVELRHAGGVSTAYCHLSRFAPGLHAGQHVDQRQLIGYVGQTGRVTGPHLHFIAKRGGRYVDPMSLKMDGVRVLPSRDRDAFKERRATLDAALDAIALPPRDGAAAPEPPADEDPHLPEN